MAKMKHKNEEKNYDDGTYVVKRNRTESIIAFVVCLLIAAAIWVYAKNSEQKNTDAPSQDGPAEQSEQTDVQA